MFSAPWSLVLPALAGLVVLPLALLVLSRQVVARLGRTESRMDELGRRLTDLESRRPDRVPNEPTPSRTASTQGDGRSRALEPALIAIPDLSFQGPLPGKEEATSELAARHGEIWELAEDGRSAESIARETGQPIGQVELILALHRRIRALQGTTHHAD